MSSDTRSVPDQKKITQKRCEDLSPVHTVAENGETTATVAEFGDSRTFLRQCGQAFISHYFTLLFMLYDSQLNCCIVCYSVHGDSFQLCVVHCSLLLS